MKRLSILFCGLALAWFALWVGNQAGVSLPDNPYDLNDLLWQVYVSMSLITYVIAGLSVLGTLFLNISYVAHFVREREDVFTSNARVFWTMLVFVGATYAYGAFVMPLELSVYPWDWFQFGGQWNFFLGMILLLPAFIIRLFVLEAWARSWGKKHPVLAAAEDLGLQVEDLRQRIAALQGRLPSAADVQADRDWKTGVTQTLDVVAKTVGDMRKEDLPAIAANAKRAAAAAPPVTPVDVHVGTGNDIKKVA